MARPRTFDEDAVLDAAIARFRAHGFAGSTIRDIEAATGLGPASLYNGFGSKQALYARCLDRYVDEGMRARVAELTATHEPRAAIERFFADIVARSLEDRHGCLLVNTALEVAPHDEAIAATVAALLGELEAFFRGRILAGKRDGSIERSIRTRAVAQLLLSTVMGIRVLARVRSEAALLRSVASEALSHLGPPLRGRHPNPNRNGAGP